MPKLPALYLTLSLLAPIGASAEYRVYQYAVRNKTVGLGELGSGKADAVTYIVTSTLDPISYQAYHGGESTFGLDLMKSWMCPGHTGALDSYCSGPMAQAGPP